MFESYAAAGRHWEAEDQRACASHIQSSHPAFACHSSYQGAYAMYCHVDLIFLEHEKLRFIWHALHASETFTALCQSAWSPILMTATAACLLNATWQVFVQAFPYRFEHEQSGTEPWQHANVTVPTKISLQWAMNHALTCCFVMLFLHSASAALTVQ